MLQYLHVKNLALIDEIEVEFGRGLRHKQWEGITLPA